MREYGKVYSRIWESADFRALSEDGRTLVLYLLTCQHATIAGVFRVPDGYACEDLQWTAERVAEGFANIAAKGFATRCESTKWVWVVKFLAWNPPENPNQRKAASKVALSVPASVAWKTDFMRVCGPSLGIEHQPFDPPPENPSETLDEGLANQKQKTEAETEKKDSGPALRAPPPPPPFDGKNSESLNGKAIVQIAGDWELPEQWGVDAEALGWKPAQVLREAEKFRQYWTAGKGQGKRRTVKGWRQSWSNWLEKAAKDQR